MYDIRPNLIIGFHGCDKYAAEALINNPNTIKISGEPHDWLGHGMYFWENNEERAMQWAVERQQRKKRPVADAAVIGAVLSGGIAESAGGMSGRITGGCWWRWYRRAIWRSRSLCLPGARFRKACLLPWQGERSRWFLRGGRGGGRLRSSCRRTGGIC